MISADYLRAGSGCWGGEADSENDGLLILRRNYSRSVNEIITKLVDVDSLTAISVCDTMIPLR